MGGAALAWRISDHNRAGGAISLHEPGVINAMQICDTNDPKLWYDCTV